MTQAASLRTGWSTRQIALVLYPFGAGAAAVNVFFASLILSWVGGPVAPTGWSIALGCLIGAPRYLVFFPPYPPSDGCCRRDARNMKIEMKEGQPIVDARDVADLLGLSAAEVQAKMRAKEITTRFETGKDEDAGRMRLTFFYNTKKVRLTCSEDGTVIKTLRTDIGGR